MSPFLQLRSWLRTGPGGERVLAGGVGVLLLALLAWATTPWGGAGGTDVVLSQPAQGAVPSPTTAGRAPGVVVVPPAAAAAPRPGAPVAGGPAGMTMPQGRAPEAAGPLVSGGVSQDRAAGVPGCGPMTATDQGVSATTITVGVVVVDLSSASGIVDVQTADQQEAAFRVAFEEVNKHGGVRCRKVVLRFYRTNPLDSTSEHAACLQMQQDKVFAVLNNLYTSTEQTCVSKAGIPNFWYTPPHSGDVRKYAPFVVSFQPDFDRLIHQYVFGAKALGFFGGMKKLGILEGSCFPDEREALFRELRRAGIDPARASTVNYGCTGAPAPQTDQSAVLQFQREGVTHVLNIAFTYDKGFSIAADQQGYDFALAHMDDVSASSIESASQKPGKSFDGTLLITTTETGANNTPGYVFNQATRACAALLKSLGQPAPNEGGNGVPCVWASLLKAAADSAPTLTRRQLAAGLARAGTQPLSYPAGPLSITDPALPTGGTLARPGVWRTECQCWRVTDVRYRSF